MQLKMDSAALGRFLAREFPQVAKDFVIEEVRPGGIVMRLKADERHLRPGGTVSGPTLFALADVAIYLALLAVIGPEALAVTTSCAIDFMRKPEPGELFAEGRLLKLGRSLAVGDVLITQPGQPGPVARASLTYSIPPRRRRPETDAGQAG